MQSGFVVLATNSDHKVACFGTITGRPFGSLAAAQRAVVRYEKRHPTVMALALFIEAEEVDRGES